MIFKVVFDNEKMKQAAKRAEAFLNAITYPDIIALAPFTHDKRATPSFVHEKIKLELLKQTYEVRTYKTWPWSKAVAMTNGDKNIYINVRKIASRDVHDYVNTFVHEALHNVGFSHGDNNYKGKERSVPYAVGALAEKWSRKQPKHITD